MQQMPEALWDIWNSGLFIGENRPRARVTIQKALLRPSYMMRTMLIQDQPQVEIPEPNVLSINIDRKLGVDAAQMTLKVLNNTPVKHDDLLDFNHAGFPESGPGSLSRRELKDLGKPGYYTFRRGVNATNQVGWHFEMTELWVDMFIPNRVIRTWQGYGTDGAANPWDDTRQILTGTWLIDKVEYSTSGEITITCRDYMKLAIEQRLYPPIIPLDFYPLEFCATYFATEPVDPEDPASVNVAFHNNIGYDSSVGYVTNVWNDSVFGHRASHMFDGDWTSYWLSLGHPTPGGFGAFEWVSAKTGGELVNFVQFRAVGGGYTAYVAVKVGGIWQGTQTVPYQPSVGEVNNGSAVAYVASAVVPSGEQWFGITLPEHYAAEEIRVIFTNLMLWSDGTYRVGIYDLEAFDHPFFEGEGEPTNVEVLVEGNIADYVDIIKILAAWCGFFWESGQPPDPALTQFGAPVGRVWGDFFYSGAYPVDPPCIPPSYWDNKSVMDGMNQIKEILGYILYADPTGGLICRMPNIWRTGNYVLGAGFIGADSIRTIDEKKVLIDYGVTIDDVSLRSQIIVVSSSDPTLSAALVPGFSADIAIPGTVGIQGDLGLLGGQERIMLVPNYPFISQAEVDKFAYLISLWIHWSYRKGKVRIPGNPAFGPDDQVLIYERITHEQFIHYIQGVVSNMDCKNGTWYLELDTHWLGEGPDRTWLINTYEDMPPALYAYLKAIGEIGEDAGTQPPVIFELPEFATTDIWDRIDDDLLTLFPDPPEIIGSAFTLSDEEIAAQVGSGYVTNPTLTSPGSVLSRSEAFWRTHWGPPSSNLVTVPFLEIWQSIYAAPPIGFPVPLNTHPGQLKTVNMTVPTLAVAAFKLAAIILAEHDYYVYDLGSYNYRYVAGTTSLSGHSWGLALDINASANYVNAPSGSVSSAFKDAMEECVATVMTNNGSQVFGWGGYWNSKKDWMHLEIVCTAADIASGVHR